MSQLRHEREHTRDEGGRAGGSPPLPFRDPIHGILALGDPGTGKTVVIHEVVKRNIDEGAGCPFVVWDRQGYWLPRKNLVRACVASAEAAAALAIEVCNREGGATLVLDEASLAYPASNPPREGSALFEIALIGRNPQAYGKWRRRGPTSLLATAQWPRTLSPILREACDRLYIGRVNGESDLEWIDEATHHDGTAARVRGLEKRRFVVWEKGR